jgi:hypothetical protein
MRAARLAAKMRIQYWNNTFQEILMKLSPYVLCLGGAAPSLFAVPTITSVANAAGNNTFNAPVAQGAVFVIKGGGLGPANIAVSSAPSRTPT